MTIHINFDPQKRQFTVHRDHTPIATLPLIYLEGRKASHINARDLERVFADAFSRQPAPQTLREGRERALRQLGLLA